MNAVKTYGDDMARLKASIDKSGVVVVTLASIRGDANTHSTVNTKNVTRRVSDIVKVFESLVFRSGYLKRVLDRV